MRGPALALLLVVLALVAFAAGAALVSVGYLGSSAAATSSGCALAAPQGTPLAANLSEGAIVTSGFHAERTVTYELGAPSLQGGSLAACSRVGDLTLRPSTDGRARVVFHLRADGAKAADALRETTLVATFAQGPDGLGIVAYPDRLGTLTRLFFGPQPTLVGVTMEVPGDAAYAFSAKTEVGNVRATNVSVRDAKVTADVGDVELSAPRAGNVSLATNVGKVRIDLDAVQGSRVAARADVGDVRVALPRASGVAYDARAEADVGRASVDLGPGETAVNGQGVGGVAALKSAGYESAPQKVTVEATTNVGNAQVVSS